jgi:RNA-directed DNA polymerase
VRFPGPTHLFFSTKYPNILTPLEGNVPRLVSELTIPSHLAINASKTRHSSKRGARRVTGIILGSDGGVYIGRHLKRRIRALIHTFDSLDEKTRASLSGMIAYAIGLDPGFMNSLINKYGLPAVRRVMVRPTAER